MTCDSSHPMSLRHPVAVPNMERDDDSRRRQIGGWGVCVRMHSYVSILLINHRYVYHIWMYHIYMYTCIHTSHGITQSVTVSHLYVYALCADAILIYVYTWVVPKMMRWFDSNLYVFIMMINHRYVNHIYIHTCIYTSQYQKWWDDSICRRRGGLGKHEGWQIHRVVKQAVFFKSQLYCCFV